MSDHDQQHLIAMPDGWSYWRSFALRSAGFPLAQLSAYAITGEETAPSAPEYLERLARQLIETAGHRRFREALTWQNPALLDTVLDPLISTPPGAWNKQHRRRALAIISYLQRYAAKNDTIGFFGPIEFGSIVDERCGLVLDRGAAIPTRSVTRFDYWAIDALAQQCSADRQLLLDVAPRLLPRYRLQGGKLLRSDGQSMTLPPAAAALLERVDGRHSARAIADELAAAGLAPGPGVVLRMVEELSARGILDWALRVPVVDEPEQALRELLKALPVTAATRRALEVVTTWQQALADIAAAAGDPDRLAPAIAACGELVTRSTGAEAVRYAGEVYAGRQPVYQDCRRGDEVAVGRDLLERLHGPLGLILASARWYTWQIAQSMQELFQARFLAMAAEDRA
ncbi:MAG: hypothetical protein HKO62_05600, partial [Gammaproteobacteria bacterium]|nr:hypothetical protein [Gammaproteobacteria bacterium]